MKVAGIIAEYNPFHKGHEFHLAKTKEETGADFVVVAMSGNYVQRGAPALLDKYSRAKSALHAGADLILQISPMYSLSSAEYFAKGSVSLLASTGIVDCLSFGSESGKISNLKKIADILTDEPEEYKKYLQTYLRSGESYPAARSKALMDYCPTIQNLTEILSSPNNILAIEYLKCLNTMNTGIKPVTIKRKGADHNDPYRPGPPGRTVLSAKAIREAVNYGAQIESLQEYLSEDTYNSLVDAIESNRIVREDDYSAMLIYKLLAEKDKGYTRYLDVSDDLSDRIEKNLSKFTSVTAFCDLLKTKDKTYTRVSRALFHILLDITNESIGAREYTGLCPYIRVLGFRKEAECLISEMKSKALVPIITGYNDAKNSLYSEPMKIFKNESYIDDLYFSVQSMKSLITSKPDMSRPLIVV